MATDAQAFRDGRDYISIGSTGEGNQDWQSDFARLINRPPLGRPTEQVQVQNATTGEPDNRYDTQGGTKSVVFQVEMPAEKNASAKVNEVIRSLDGVDKLTPEIKKQLAEFTRQGLDGLTKPDDVENQLDWMNDFVEKYLDGRGGPDSPWTAKYSMTNDVCIRLNIENEVTGKKFEVNFPVVEEAPRRHHEGY